MNHITFGVWLNPGDFLTHVQLDIYTKPDNGGTFVFGFTSSNVVQGSCETNSAGASVCLETVDLQGAGPTLSAGTYWLQLYNGETLDGSNTVSWDINQGIGCTSPGCPFLAVDEKGGIIPSEAFAIYSGVGIQPTPEPGSLVLLGTGVMGLAGAARRKTIHF